MAIFETKVLDIIQRAPNVRSFRFKSDADTDFKPGQFFFVGITIEGRETSKHFSFSNSPTEKGYVEFTKRLTNSPFSYALAGLKIGSQARLKMPYGSFTFGGEYAKIAFLSAGIGITPIRSICKFVCDKRLPTEIALVYGNNKEEDIIFRQDFEQMSLVNKNMRVVYTLTAENIDRHNWPGRTGYIDGKMLKEEIPDFQERVFYICGPPQMVAGLTAILKDELAVSADKIKLENFIGY